MFDKRAIFTLRLPIIATTKGPSTKAITTLVRLMIRLSNLLRKWLLRNCSETFLRWVIFWLVGRDDNDNIAVANRVVVLTALTAHGRVEVNNGVVCSTSTVQLWLRSVT